VFRLGLLARSLNRCGRGLWDNAFFHQMGKKDVQGNQLSGACGADAPLVRQIAEIFVDMTSGHVLRSSGGHIICIEPGEKLLNICAIRLYGQRAFVQFARKLV